MRWMDEVLALTLQRVSCNFSPSHWVNLPPHGMNLVASELQRDVPWLRKPEQSTQRTLVGYSGSACMGNGRRKYISKRRAAVPGLTLPKSAVSSVSGNEGTESEATGTAVNASCSSKSLDETHREFIMDISTNSKKYISRYPKDGILVY